MENEALAPITIAPDEPKTQPVMLADPTAVTYPPSPPIAANRAEKATIGLSGVTSDTDADILSSIAGGREQEFRERAASTLNFKAAMAREDALMDAYKKKGKSLDYNDVRKILDPFSPENKPADPIDVIEKAYASKYVSAANTAASYMQATVMDDAAKEIPEELAKKQAGATELISKLEITNNLQQEVQEQLKRQSTAGYLWDQAKTMFQPYNEYMMRGLNPEVGKFTGGVLLGSNMKAQADELLRRPTDEFAKGLKTIVSELSKSNPTLAEQFLDYVKGVSTQERTLQNVFTILTPLDYYSIGKGGVSLARKVSVNNRASVAFRDVVKSAEKTDGQIPVRAVMAEGAGDVTEAGIQRTANNITKSLNGSLDPIQDVKEKLTSNFRLDGSLLDTNPGKLSTPMLTVLKDGFVASSDKLMEVIGKALRVNRTPIPLATEDAIRAYQAAERAKFPGMDNSILDLSSPYHNLETNTNHIAITFGNNEGRLFSDAETAVNYAKQQGFADPRIFSATGEVEKQAAQLTGPVRSLNRLRQLEGTIPLAEAALQRTKDFLGKKFIGPKTPASIAKATEDRDFFKNTIDKYKKEATEERAKTSYTDPVIEQNGLGYKFTIVRPYTETDPTVRSWLINKNAKGEYVGPGASSAQLQNWSSWKNSWLGWVRGADDTLSFNESVQRKVAVYTQTLLRQWAKDDAKYLEEVSNQFKWMRPQTWFRAIGNNQMFEEFNSTLRFAKTMRDDKGQVGAFFKTPGDLEAHYMEHFNRLPTFPEQQGYFAHVRLVEGNRVLSEIAEFRNRARLGASQHSLAVLAKDGTKLESDYFDGVQHQQFPGGNGQILVAGAHQGEEKVYFLGANDIPSKDLERYRNEVKTGQAKIIEVYDPDSHPLSAFFPNAGDKRIRYVLTHDSQSKGLDLNHVNRRGGGHFDVDADYYIKQANISDELSRGRVYKKTYTGDNTLMPINNGVMGREIAGNMTKINGFMADGSEAAIEQAKALARKSGIEWEQIERWYKPDEKTGKSFINHQEPFYLVPRNKTIFDLDKTMEERIGKEYFQDGTKSGSLAQQFQVAYNRARDSEDLFTVKDFGTQGNPLYKSVPAEYVDPIPTMSRALTRAINSTFMDDYKIYAVEHWLTEAIPHLKASESEVRSAPFWHFNNASEKGAFKSGTSDEIKSNLMSNRFKINQFVGIPNKIESSIHSLTQILVDNFYNKYGPEEERGILAKSFTVIPLWALSKASDPVASIRSFAFNAKLGVFSPAQFLVQAQTFTSIIGISPRAGMAGTYATMLHQWSRINSNPEILKAFDNYASKLNMFGSKWKTGEWLEARQELSRTGFEHVGGEYQLADDQMTHKFIKNSFGNFLDAGQVFFKEGERASRLGAYYTAFREFRDVNPTKILTEADRASILNRADLLTTNMSRASASTLHSGVLSLTTQFLSYQLRMAELFLGKRLGETVGERSLARARILGMYTAMYGAPSALGVSGYPFGDSIREYAINNGYVVGDSYMDSLMNGIPAWTMAQVTGKYYNVGDRYGTQGFTQIREAMRSDNSMWKIFGGAGVSTMANTIASLDPFWQAAKSLVSDDEEGNQYKLTASHFNGLFSEFASMDAATRAIYALHTGRWISKNEGIMETDISSADTLFRTITGLKTQQQDDVFSIKNIKDSEEKVQKAATKEIIKEYHRGIDAMNDNNPDLANTYFTNARARMISSGMPLDMRTKVLSNATRGFETQIETSLRNWSTKNVPAGQEALRLDAAQRHQQLQGK